MAGSTIGWSGLNKGLRTFMRVALPESVRYLEKGDRFWCTWVRQGCSTDVEFMKGKMGFVEITRYGKRGTAGRETRRWNLGEMQARSLSRCRADAKIKDEGYVELTIKDDAVRQRFKTPEARAFDFADDVLG